jgi:hypothetical protein
VVHDLGDLQSGDFREGSAEDGEVLCVGTDRSTFDLSVPRYDRVAVESLFVQTEV